MTQAQISLPPDASAPSKARELLLRVMADQTGSEQRRGAVLALSEIVTNAVLYGATDETDPISLLIDRTEDVVTIRVIQPRPVPEHLSIADVPDGWPTGGYGLRIVDRVADRWGVQSEPPSVWFELRL
jgi:anti-sigma regulatory factor (Ser/Thr protein kinase)